MKVNRSLLWSTASVILTIVGISLYSYFFNVNQPSPPQIEITPSSYNFGMIPYRAVEKSFIVRNVGGSPLRITGISTSCGCTSAEIERDELLPGEETKLLVTFNPNLMEERLAGEIYRVVYVKSNDPKRPEVEIEIRATLKLKGNDES